MKILVSPLDWGLGHASRMIPVVRYLKKKDHQVILGGGGRSLELLKTTFPELPYVVIPFHPIKLGSGRFSFIRLMGQVPLILWTIHREHKIIERLIDIHSIDIVISDNRYGLWNPRVFSVFVTHQVSPVLPAGLRWLGYPLYRIIRNRMEKFDWCWIPDFADKENSLAGDLCHRHRLPANAEYVGILSRFSANDPIPSIPEPENAFDFVAVMSGPEPQVSVFEEKLLRGIIQANKTALFLRGLRDQPSTLQVNGGTLVKSVAHLDDSRFRLTLMQAGTIICRSGYTTICDLRSLGLTAILVPTPGQSEQEYLGKRFSIGTLFKVIPERQLKNLDFSELNKSLSSGAAPATSDLSFLDDLEGKYENYHKESQRKT